MCVLLGWAVRAWKLLLFLPEWRDVTTIVSHGCTTRRVFTFKLTHQLFVDWREC